MSWPMVALGEVAEFINGAAFKPGDWSETGRRIIRIQNLNDRTKPYNRTERKVRDKYLVPPGTLLVSWSASLGVFDWAGPDTGLLNQHIFKVEPHSTHVDQDYLKHLLRKALVDMQRFAHGSTMVHVNRGEFLSTKIPLPPLDEQRRIAAILDKADALRRARERSVELQAKLISALFEGRRTTGTTAKLSELADIQIGHPFQSKHYTEAEDAIRLCRGANIAPHGMDWGDLRRWPSDRYAEFRKFDLMENDIVLAMDRPWISSGLKLAVIEKRDLPALLVQRVARLRVHDPRLAYVVFLALRSRAFEFHCKTTETTVPHISPNDIRSFEIDLPDDCWLDTFDRAVGRCRAMENRLRDAADGHAALFTTLRNRAFAGEL